MPCRTHPTVTGVNTCNQCGEWLCEDCTIEINGRIFCRGCLGKLTGGAGDAPSAPRTATKKRHINGFLLLIFSFPGVNYMYMGLIKRGLAAMAGFFLLIYLLATFNELPFSLIFGLSMPVYWMACIFDGFNTRRRINAGETVSDDVDDVVGFIKRNKNLIISFIILLLAVAAVGSIFSMLPGFITRGVPIIVVGLGLYVLFKRPNK